MSARKNGGLRRSVIIAAAALVLMAGGISAALVTLTSALHETTGVLRDTVRAVRLTAEARADLLLFDQSTDAAERARLEARLRSSFYPPDLHHLSPQVHEAERRASAAIARYLEIADATPRGDTERALRAALDEIEPVSVLGVKAADQAREHASRLDTLANVIGIAAASMMLLVVGGAAFWIQRAVLRPVLTLSDAMDRFGAGDLGARAEPRGTAEVRRIMERFNIMGASLTRQRQARLTHIAGVAHDLRNPLAALQMSAALVDPEQPLPPETAVRRTLAVIRRQVSRLNRMVEDLLDASQIDAGRLELEMGDVDLDVLVKDVAGLFRDVSPNHVIEVARHAENTHVTCDAVRIEQVLSNLVSNAIKYSPRGGSIVLSISVEDERAKISVSDPGIGIAASEIDELWEPFRRSRGVSTESVPGVGLGLWTSKRIANAHGGDIVVTSKIGRGSTFTLVLPRSRTVKENAPESPAMRGELAPASSHG